MPAESMTEAESSTMQAPEASSTPVADLFAIAKVNGEAYTKLPDDLYIPPDALRVFLDTFEGPLDLLLYLIRAQNIDILNIPVARITHQYLEYVNLMQAENFDLAAEYLLMAAWLGEIKSRLLLPRPVNADGEEELDPRAELIRRLQEYERFKQAAEHLDSLPCEGRDFFIAEAQAPEFQRTLAPPQVELRELLLALQDVLNRADLSTSHQVSRETLSLRERMSNILELLRGQRFVPFVQLFTVEEGRLGVVVSFMAILELVKEGLIDVVQADAFADLHVRARVAEVQGTGYDLADEDDDGVNDAIEIEADEPTDEQDENDVERAFNES